MDWFIKHLDWIILGVFAIPFTWKVILYLTYESDMESRRKRYKARYGDDDPAGNDNINRNFYDYM